MDHLSETEGYIHIPFCAKKCSYCDFLSFSKGRRSQQSYVDALLKEIRSRSSENKDYRMRSVFLGGGTPSLLEDGLIRQIMEAMYENYDIATDAEITIEANPCTITERKLDEYRKAGINRISIGCQSLNDEQLKTLGRLHDSKGFFHAFELVRKAGFTNINVDLMSGLPDQSAGQWAETLRRIAELKVQHISAYSLIIEEGTKFYQLENTLHLPDENELDRMYRETSGILKEYGMRRYEISNYSLPGYESRHNLGYWTGVRYEGFGLGASSYENNTRFCNTSDYDRYLSSSDESEKIRCDITKLEKADLYSEYMILGLRLTDGVSVSGFEHRFGVTMDRIFGTALRKHLGQGSLKIENDRIFIPEKYLFVSNQILTDFI